MLTILQLVTDMTKSDVQDSCEHSDACVDNSGVRDTVTDMTKSDVQDSCEQSSLLLTILELMTM